MGPLTKCDRTVFYSTKCRVSQNYVNTLIGKSRPANRSADF
jgi:predicted DCC family thiol-disulfide oxidoreductase YuxK